MQVHQHIPSFVDGITPIEAEVNTLAELEALEFVERWKKRATFHRLSIHWDYADHTHLLMAEFEEGRRWWVVAKLIGEDAQMCAPLPGWEAR